MSEEPEKRPIAAPFAIKLYPDERDVVNCFRIMCIFAAETVSF